MMKILFPIFGKSGSGKSRIVRDIKELKPEYNIIQRATTRPKREGTNDYDFLTIPEFEEKQEAGEIIGTLEFNNWLYGTYKDSILEDAVNIGAYDIDSVRELRKISDIEIYPIYIEAPDKVRLLRQLNREENPNVKEIFRRYQTDEFDYRDIDFFHLPVDNSGKISIHVVVAQVLLHIDRKIKK